MHTSNPQPPPKEHLASPTATAHTTALPMQFPKGNMHHEIGPPLEMGSSKWATSQVQERPWSWP